MIDMAGTDNRKPWEDFSTLISELEHYNESLTKKPYLVVANKMDIETSADNLKKFKKHHKVDIILISCSEKSNIDTLKLAILSKIS